MARVTTSDGVDVAVHDLGGAGPPLVCAHGAGLHGRLWEPLAAHLSDHFHCLAVDLRGHGCSPLPDVVRLDWPGFARDVLAAVATLASPDAPDSLDATAAPAGAPAGGRTAGSSQAAARPFGLGHSGGATALLLAEQARPGTFGALYCFEPVFLPAGTADVAERGRRLAGVARKRRDRFSSRDEARAVYASKPPFDAFAPEALAAYLEHGFDESGGGVRLRCRPEIEARVYETAADHDGLDRLGEVGCHVTIAYGSDTDVLTGPRAEALAGRLPRGRVEEVRGVGHFGPFEDPAAVAAAVEAAFSGR